MSVFISASSEQNFKQKTHTCVQCARDFVNKQLIYSFEFNNKLSEYYVDTFESVTFFDGAPPYFPFSFPFIVCVVCIFYVAFLYNAHKFCPSRYIYMCLISCKDAKLIVHFKRGRKKNIQPNQ